MFSATVAQKPTMPVSAGTKKRQNAALSRKRLGALSTGPKPLALRVTHISSSTPIASMKGAPIPSRNLMVRMPGQIQVEALIASAACFSPFCKASGLALVT
jgi:hypothetical protein